MFVPNRLYLPIPVYLLVSCLTFSAFGARNACSRVFELRQVQSSVDPHLEKLRNNLWAVHATDHLSEGRILKAGLSNSSPRATTHFTLGELVPAHDHGQLTWEKKSYAVLTQIKNLENRLVNLTATDTFIIGSYEIQPGDVIIVENGAHLPNIRGVEIITFDHQRTTLREMIRDTLQEKKAYKMDSSNFYLHETVTKIDGVETTMTEFLKPLLREHPAVSFSDHAHHTLGKIELAYHNWDNLLNGRFAREMNRVEWHIVITELKRLAQERDHLAGNVHLTGNPLKEYLRAKESFDQVVRIIQVELILQNRFGKSILASENRMHTQEIFKKHGGNTEEIVRDLRNSSFLVEAPRYSSDGFEDPIETFIYQSNPLKADEFAKMVDSYPEITTSLGRAEFLKAARALIQLKPDHGVDPALKQLILAELRQTMSEDQFLFFHYNLSKNVELMKFYLSALADPYAKSQIEKHYPNIDKLKNHLLSRIQPQAQ